MSVNMKPLRWSRGALVPITLAVTTGCASNLSTEPGPGVDSGPRTVRLTDNAGASVGDVSYHVEDNIVIGVIDTTPNEAWPHLLAAYEAVGLEPDILDEARLTVGVSEVRLRRRLGDRSLSNYLSCGRSMTGELADRGTVRLRISSTLRTTPAERTQLRTTLQANAVDNDGTSRDVRTCYSNHRLEASVYAHVAEAVGAGM